MKKMIYLALFLCVACVTTTKSQVSIGSTEEPHPAAVLDLKQTNKGLLLPRVSLNDVSVFQLLANPTAQQKTEANGMMIYNTKDNTLVGGVAGTATKGVYVWTGSEWKSAMSTSTAEVIAPPTASGVEKCASCSRYDFDGNGLLTEDEAIDVWVFNTDNSSGTAWSNSDTEYYTATSQTDGLANVNKAKSQKGSGTTLYAIKICDDLNTSAPGTGGQWYLPSSGEQFPYMVSYIKSTGGSGNYWTSTEYAPTIGEDVYVTDVNNERPASGYKLSTAGKVRCIWRANSPTKIQ